MGGTVKISTVDLEAAANSLWEQLRPHLSYLSAKDQEVVELAFWQMKEAHQDQRRKSGDFYITHPVAACIILCKMGLDRDTLAACLLHDVPEDTEVSLKTLQKNFGSQITFLVSGITKLSKVKYKGDDRYSENLRRMFVAMSKDLRVIFIKLADRTHNLQTLKHVPPEKAKRIALESLEIYAPIAERLGIGYFKGEIEDAVFPFLYPEVYKHFISISDLAIHKRQKQVDSIAKKTKRLLTQESVPFITLVGRAKRYYSLFRKLQEKDKTLDQIYDLVALRVVTDSVENCYRILSHIHRSYEPLPKRMKDYISQPKSNGYQSIHTTVRDPDTGLVFEFQIRTQEMHDYAEYGVAAHWAYKEKRSQTEFTFLDPQNLKWISELVDIGKEEMDEEEYLAMVKLDLFQDRIFVMTPKGDVIDLPQGATSLDFAFRIHEEVGCRAVMAKVNGSPKKLMEELHNGDLVEILTDKKQKPKPDWLHWVRTVTAARRIRGILRKDGHAV